MGNNDILANLYRLQPLKIRRAEHLSAMMYRLSKDNTKIEKKHPIIHLRSRNEIKFKIYKRQYEKYLKSPMSRGVVLLNYLGISWTSQFQNGPSLFMLFQAYYDVTTGHMTLRFEIFWRETANWQRRKQASLGRENTPLCRI